MKHLQKFKESSSESNDDIDMEYIDICFVDFIDEGRYKSRVYKDNLVSIAIHIPEEYSIPYFSGSISDLLKVVKWKEDEYLKVEEVLNKIKIKIPNLKYMIYFNDHENLESDAYMNIMLSYNDPYYHTI